MLSLNLPEGALCELLYADDLVLMREAIEGLRYKFIKWKEAFESKGLKVNLGKTKVMVSSGITQGLGIAVSCCMVNDFLQSRKGLFIGVM